MIDVLHDSWSALWQFPHVGLYVGLGWLLYLVGLGGWIVLQKREPAATMSWLLGLALLPLAGFLIYHVFGPQRIHRHRLRRARSRARLPAPDGEDSTSIRPRRAIALALRFFLRAPAILVSWFRRLYPSAARTFTSVGTKGTLATL